MKRLAVAMLAHVAFGLCGRTFAASAVSSQRLANPKRDHRCRNCLQPAGAGKGPMDGVSRNGGQRCDDVRAAADARAGLAEGQGRPARFGEMATAQSLHVVRRQDRCYHRRGQWPDGAMAISPPSGSCLKNAPNGDGEWKWVLDHGDFIRPRRASTNEMIETKVASCKGRGTRRTGRAARRRKNEGGLSRDQSLSYTWVVQPDGARTARGKAVERRSIRHRFAGQGSRSEMIDLFLSAFITFFVSSTRRAVRRFTPASPKARQRRSGAIWPSAQP